MKATKDYISLETAKMLSDGSKMINEKVFYNVMWDELPPYSWQEILWEYPEEFFNNKYIQKSYTTITETILSLLQQKKYEEADLYFRENCILISK